MPGFRSGSAAVMASMLEASTSSGHPPISPTIRRTRQKTGDGFGDGMDRSAGHLFAGRAPLRT